MEATTYELEASSEANHWWFVCRRELFFRELSSHGAKVGDRILDIGSSTGTNLRMLRDRGFTNFRGLDLSDHAIAHCAAKGFDNVTKGDAAALPFEDASFDVVLATDIVEHVDDDMKVLGEIARVLRPGGNALITVPAFQSLWGLQDDVSHHKRRYRLAEIRTKTVDAGLACRKAYYFNFVLFPAIWGARQALRWLKPDVESENQLTSPLINRILTWVFAVDIALAPRLRPPFGVSALVVAEKCSAGGAP